MNDVRIRHRHVDVDGSSLHVVEAGDSSRRPFVFLHGWPESWRTWQSVMSLAGRHVHAIALDLPGIGASTGDATDGSKGALADKIHGLIEALGLKGTTLVGHDIGGMVVYSYWRRYRDIRAAVIMDVVVPGIPPWEEVLRNPQIWHFALHAVPDLPERLVQGRQKEYFAFFYDALSSAPDQVTTEARADYAEAYSTDAALTAGFNWYRAFARDAEINAGGAGEPLHTPLLYLRGQHERGGRIDEYVRGLEGAGATSLEHGLIPASKHFTQEERPDDVWQRIARFAGLDLAPTA